MSSTDPPIAPVEVTRADPDQWPVARTVRLRALAAEPEHFGVSLLPEEARAPSDWRQQLARQSWFFAHRRTDGAVVGMAVFDPDDTFPDGAPQLGSMWVDPIWRGRGVARALVASVEDAARGAGVHALGLWVTVGNDQARDVYARLGYALTGATKPAPRDPAVAMHRMVKRFTPRAPAAAVIRP